MRKARGLVGTAAIVSLALIGVVASAQASVASTPTHAALSVTAQAPQALVPQTGSTLPAHVGIDVSYPQCDGTDHVAYPAGVPFAVVGVNKGLANDLNPCFVSEYADAQALGGSEAEPLDSVYLNTGDPALAGSWWPSSNQTEGLFSSPVLTVENPDGTCAHKAGPKCAYIYGYSMAEADVYQVSRSYTPSTWWLDVETSNTWQSDTSANAWVIRGMSDYLKSQDLTVGVYSTASQWKKIVGTVSSTSAIAGFPSWIAGTSASTAADDCTASGLTPGSAIWMLQYTNSGLDNDYACQLFPDVSATITPSSTSYEGTKLTAVHGVWASGTVSYAYQWLRNNVAISGATSSTRTTTSSDLGKTISVRITAKADGDRTTSLASAGVPIVGEITSKALTLSGTAQAGGTLKVTHGTWSPSTVSYTVAWYRGDTLVTSGTSETYALTDADIGSTITVIVTASKTGYASTSRQATSAEVAAS